MKLTHSVRYDAGLEDVRDMLTDPAFREKATYAQGATSVDVEVSDGAVRITLVRPNDDVPGFARKLAGGESLTATQAEDWNDDHSASFSITTRGVPAGISGTRTLVADGDGTLDTFEGEAKAKVPVIGGRIEKLIAEKLHEGWDQEHEIGTAWLRGER